MLCRNGFLNRFQRRRLFLCFQKQSRFWYATVCILMCVEHRLYYVFPGGISNLRYSRCRNGFRLLHLREYKRSGSWTSAEIFQNNVWSSAVPCCLINENVNVVEVGHQQKSFRITIVVVPCRVARLPSSCFALRRAKRVRSSAPPACRGEISASPRWSLVGGTRLELMTSTVWR